MNVTVNDVGPCKKIVRVEVGQDQVDKTLGEVEKDIQKHAALPGFRKGKAPAAMILKAFEKEIVEEAQKKLLSESYREAIKEQKLSVYALLNVEEVDFQRGKPMQFVATVEVFPQYELPAYKGLPAKRENRGVTDADVDHAIEMLRGRMATFEKVDRPAQQGDIAVVNYTGSCDGKPILELAPASRNLATQQGFWIEIREGAFIPGFAEQLTGATAGGKRSVTVTFPADFAVEGVRGKQAVYDVDVIEIKERILPPLDDEFAKKWEASDMKGLREGVRGDLQHELNEKVQRDVRAQVVRALVEPMSFDMPESAVLAETRNVVYEIVNENQKRGVSKEIIDKNKDDIFNAANTAARERVKAAFVFGKIAEQEGIKVEQREFDARLYSMAKSMEMTPDKLLKELQKRDGVQSFAEKILQDKVVDFLQQHAKIEDVAPAAPAA